MKTTAIALLGIFIGITASADTITLPCTTSGHCAKSAATCDTYYQNEFRAGKENFGLTVSRAFLSFAHDARLKNATITDIQLLFNVTSVPSSYQVKFYQMHLSHTDCTDIWNDAGDGTLYRTLTIYNTGGSQGPGLANAIGDLTTAMNANQDFFLGMAADSYDAAHFYGNGSAYPPYLTIQYTPAEYVNTPAISYPDAPDEPAPVNVSVATRCAATTTSYSHPVEYRFDFGDGSAFSSWSSSRVTAHTFTSAGTYALRAQARCATHTTVTSLWSTAFSIRIRTPVPTVSTTLIDVGTVPLGITSANFQISDTAGYFTPYNNTNTFTWTASDNQTWLSESPTSGGCKGSGTTNVSVTINTTGLSYDTLYSGTITVVSTYGANKTVTVQCRTQQHTVSTPNTPSGPSPVTPGSSQTYTSGGASCSVAGHSIQYRFDWGDGSFSSWSAGSSASHSWPTTSTYQVKAQARCATDNAILSSWSSAKSVVVVNHTVSVPSIPTGPTSGDPNQTYSFLSGSSSCSLEHSVQYQFDWGDSTYSGWLSDTSASHSWSSHGTYQIRARARCVTDNNIVTAWSDSSSISIGYAPVSVLGYWKFVDGIYDYATQTDVSMTNGIPYAKVELYDNEPTPLPPALLATTYTDQNGYFHFDNVSNNDGPLEGGVDLFVKIYADYAPEPTKCAKVCWGDPLNAILQYTYTTNTQVYGDCPGGLLDMGTNIIPAESAGPWIAYEAAVTAYNFFKSSDFSHDNAKVPIFWPDNTLGGQTVSEGAYFKGLGYFGVSVVYQIGFKDTPSRTTTYHEYGHAVMYKLYGDTMPPTSVTDYEHAEASEKDEGFALSEGWAEFCEDWIDRYYRASKGFAISTNPDFDGQETHWADFLSTTNSQGVYVCDGNIVEGAVGEVFWDIADSGPTDDDGLQGKLSYVIDCFKSAKPNSIGQLKAWWQINHSESYEALQKIFWEAKIERHPDTVSPSPVQNLHAESQPDGSVAFSWQNPTSSDFAGVLVLRSDSDWSDQRPIEPMHQSVWWQNEAWESFYLVTAVYKGTGMTFVDTDFVPGKTYYYKIATFDGVPNYSEAIWTHVTSRLQVCTPTITPNGGTFANLVQVTLACSTVGATIRYTTDGTDPTSSSTTYSNPFTLTGSAPVKAKAFLSEYNDSLIAVAHFTVNPVNISVTVQPSPSGRSFTVDGAPYTTSQIFSWVSGSSHTIATTSPQSGGTGIQYVWSSWSDGRAMSHTVSPTSGTTYTANFITQYYLTMSMGTGGSSVSPASGWYNSGTGVGISAAASNGYSFTSWAGSGSGSYSGTSSSASVTMNGPISETASFTPCTYALSPTATNIIAGAFSGSFSVTTSGGCSWTANPNDGWLHTTSSGTGNGTVNFTADANPGSNPRPGTINVGGQSFTVTQTGVNQLPQITQQPESVAIDAGATASFSVTVTSSTALSYQWRKGGTNLANGGRISGVATNILTITSVQTNDAGNYTVWLTNSAGSITSSIATLTIGAPVRLQISRSGSQVLLSWRTNWSDYVLETRTNLSAPAIWIVVTNGVVISGNSCFLTNPPTSKAAFYRLRKQTNSTPSGMALIPAGSFTMGDNLDGLSDAVPISVTVSAFYMDTNLVSYNQWQSLYNWATNHGYGFVHAGAGKAANHPVQTVDWYDTAKWCNARSQQASLTPVYYTDAGLMQVYTNGEVTVYVNWAANGYRLPTEAESEKAARGGASGQRFPWGDTISWSQADYYALPLSAGGYTYDVNPTEGYNPTFTTGGYPYTSPVGYFAPNGYGLYDMAGNVWQWCWDWYDGSWYSNVGATQTDTRGPASSPYGWRVLRGGCWGVTAYNSRCAHRGYGDPIDANDIFGFRCVRGF